MDITQESESSISKARRAPLLIDSGHDSDDDPSKKIYSNDFNDDDDYHDHDSYYEKYTTASSAQSTETDSDSIPSNELLLGTAFLSFMSFAVVQSFFAIIAGSKAMMGDSAAMLVDAVTYLFNWIAERSKRRFDDACRLEDTQRLLDGQDVQHAHEQQLHVHNNNNDPVRARRIRERSKRKMVLKLEIFPPCLSVFTLIIVTGVVLHKAIQILILDMHRDPSEQLRPNVNMMMAFSLVNLLLDGMNVFCFARAKHLLGYSTSTLAKTVNATDTDMDMDDVEHGAELSSTTATTTTTTTTTTVQGSAYRQVNDDSEGGHEHDELELQGRGHGHDASCSSNNNKNGAPVQAVTDGIMRNHGRGHGHGHDDNDNLFDDNEEEETEHANLNMCSAYTHVFADTLRSIAVIVAAGIAEVVDSVTPEEADAAAAVVVSILVLLSLIPLFHGLVQSVSELRAIRREEESETMFPEHANATTELN
jgi:Co/Zn/Cd efflux system component